MLTGSCHCGAVTWTYEGNAQRVTACSCSICRRYGVLWLYGFEEQQIAVAGDVEPYRRGDLVNQGLSFNFCHRCGCVAYWRADHLDSHGRRRIAVNVRLAEPETVAHLEVRHFDGLDSWQEVPGSARTLGHMWF